MNIGRSSISIAGGWSQSTVVFYFILSREELVNVIQVRSFLS